MSDPHLAEPRGLDDHGAQPAPAIAARHKARSVVGIALEIALISVGVFLGLAGQQWRESAQHRELARSALRDFRSEIAANDNAVAAVLDYHVAMRKRIDAYLAADQRTRQSFDLGMKGLRPVPFEHTAWDLALATQSLTYVDQPLAFAIAHVYNAQQGYADLTRGMLQTMYLRPPAEGLGPFLNSVSLYYDDIVMEEPELRRLYRELLPRIDHALGSAPPVAPAATPP